MLCTKYALSLYCKQYHDTGLPTEDIPQRRLAGICTFCFPIFMVNLGKKVTGKKFLKKNLEIKTLVKKSKFSEVLGQNVTGNKVGSF